MFINNVLQAREKRLNGFLGVNLGGQCVEWPHYRVNRATPLVVRFAY